MGPDLYSKVQNALWWITSIATSVVCCSVIFVLFASYLVDVRQEIKEGNMRINLIEEREDRILTEIEMIRKHGVGPMSAAPAAPAAPDAASAASAPATPAAAGEAAQPASIELPAQGSVSVPTAPTPAPVPPPAAPAAPAPEAAPAALPSVAITPPSLAPSSDKK